MQINEGEDIEPDDFQFVWFLAWLCVIRIFVWPIYQFLMKIIINLIKLSISNAFGLTMTLFDLLIIVELESLVVSVIVPF